MFPQSFLSWLQISTILSMVLNLSIDFSELRIRLACPSQKKNSKFCGGSQAAQVFIEWSL